MMMGWMYSEDDGDGRKEWMVLKKIGGVDG